MLISTSIEIRVFLGLLNTDMIGKDPSASQNLSNLLLHQCGGTILQALVSRSLEQLEKIADHV
jgi:hypothetical protein